MPTTKPITEQDVENQQGMLSTAGWRYLDNDLSVERATTSAVLLTEPERRAVQYPDAFWRGYFAGLQFASSRAEQLISEGMSLSLMHFQEIWPFPKQAVIRRLDQAKRWIVVENNYTGQLAGILQEQTGRCPDGTILKYDGRPFFFEELLSAVRKEVGT